MSARVHLDTPASLALGRHSMTEPGPGSLALGRHSMTEPGPGSLALGRHSMTEAGPTSSVGWHSMTILEVVP